MNVKGLNEDDILQVSKNDKKMDAGMIRFVLLEQIGKAVIRQDVTDQELREAIQSILI